MDAMFIACECVDARLKGAEAGIMCKLDVEKIYDRCKQRFLLNTLRQMGFGEKWIEFCIKTIMFSILVKHVGLFLF